jgi:hypothetical protein
MRLASQMRARFSAVATRLSWILVAEANVDDATFDPGHSFEVAWIVPPCGQICHRSQ